MGYGRTSRRPVWSANGGLQVLDPMIIKPPCPLIPCAGQSFGSPHNYPCFVYPAEFIAISVLYVSSPSSVLSMYALSSCYGCCAFPSFKFLYTRTTNYAAFMALPLIRPSHFTLNISSHRSHQIMHPETATICTIINTSSMSHSFLYTGMIQEHGAANHRNPCIK